MAMADRRPLGVPLASAHASPAFNTDGIDPALALKVPKNAGDISADFGDQSPPAFSADGSVSPTQMSPSLRSISPDLLMNSGPGIKKNVSSNSSRGSTPGGFYEKAGLGSSTFGKKPKPAARMPIATGISTTIPVTGEKPKPTQSGDASLEDDVLYAIFLILYEKDTEGAGMTVKQICDVLVERHPEMAQLSSKTSNLVSAKLNAYVKRVEKGDANLKYALSREWADALPKRMVYVYRGLLAKDFHVHVKHAMEKQGPLSPLTLVQSLDQSLGPSKSLSQSQRKSQTLALNLGLSSATAAASSAAGASPSFSTDSFEAAKQSALLKPRRQTMFDLGISRHAFAADPADASALFVPYSLAPVAANMARLHAVPTPSPTPTPRETDAENAAQDDAVSPSHVTDADTGATAAPGAAKRFFNDSDFDFDDLEVFNDTDDDDDDLSAFPLRAAKRLKSMSHLPAAKKAKFVTAAAAAPRVPRTPCSHSPHAAAAAAALHAAALKAIAAATASMGTGIPADSADTALATTTTRLPRARSNSNWAHAVKSGFLTQEIGAPEDVSLSDLDKLFG